MRHPPIAIAVALPCALACLLSAVGAAEGRSAAASPRKAAPPPRPGEQSWTGVVGPGREEASFQVPAARGGGLYRIQLRGSGRADIDMRVVARGGGSGPWESRGPEAEEMVIVPAGRALTVTVSHYSGDECPFTLTAEPLGSGATLRSGGRQRGEVDYGGQREAYFRIPGSRQGGVVRVNLEGERGDVDLDLIAYGPDFSPIGESRGPAATESLVLALGTDDLFVSVQAYGDGDASAFEIECEALSREAERVVLGTPIEATVEPGGERFYRVSFTRNEILDVQLRGRGEADIDMQVIGSDGTIKSSEGGDGEERVAVNARRGKYYVIRVYGAGAGVGGPFTLTVESIGASRLPRNGSGGTRWWSVCVGIEDYAEVNDLDYTCGDALDVFDYMAHHGPVDPRRSIVLIDDGATKAAVVAALREIASRADEDDVFFFFFSGHGGNGHRDGESGDRQDERDGADEYIVCYDSASSGYDGDITDDELEQLLDAIPARRQLVFLDSCFGGGFEEIVSRDGRVGVFSSLERQTSTEARAFKAGLMVGTMLNGLRGGADRNDDGEVTHKELVGYVMEIVPRLCPGCQGWLSSSDRRCRSCGQDLAGDGERQIPVSRDRLAEEVVMATGARRDAVPAPPPDGGGAGGGLQGPQGPRPPKP